jgi:hypothetical protein
MDYIWFTGPPKLYVAPFDPVDGAEPKPSHTIAYGTALGGNFVDMGKTQGGITFQPSFENRDFETDQDDAPPAGMRIANGATLQVPLLKGTLANILMMLGQGKSTSGVNENELAVGGGSPFIDYLTFCLEGLHPESTKAAPIYRRLYIPKMSPSEAPEMPHKKDEEIVLSGTFKAYTDSDQAVGERLWKVLDDIPA